MKNTYEKLIENKDYDRVLQSMSDEDKKALESFAQGLCQHVDGFLNKILGSIGNQSFSEEEILKAIRDKTGTR